MTFSIKSKSTINIEAKKYRDKLEKEYQKKLQEIVEYVKKDSSKQSEIDLVKKVYEWFCDNIEYDSSILAEKKQDGTFINKEYLYQNGKFWRSEKYAILCGKGVCESISLAMKDVYLLLGIECKYVTGTDDNVLQDEFKGKHRAWNEIELEGKAYTIDWTPHLGLLWQNQEQVKLTKKKEFFEYFDFSEIKKGFVVGRHKILL